MAKKRGDLNLKRIIKNAKKFHPKAKTSMIEEAFYFSKEAHKKQFRKSGERYFTHPVAVATLLAENGLDEVVITAGLLHDVLEDTDASGDEIRKIFGSEVYRLVESSTKLKKAMFTSRQEQSTASMQKTIIASAKDLRVLLIKIFDKLHNMRTIDFLPRSKQKRISADCLTVYIPLAHMLGMHEVKYEMEDLCFKAAEPKKFEKARKTINAARAKKSAELQKAVKILKKRFPKNHWKLGFKKKSYYSIYSKAIAQNREMRSLNDVLILNIIVPGELDCYKALGRVHTAFKPIPFKTKDFIALPEYGIYQSLHTQVIGPSKKPIKVYIFSEKMFEVASKGVLALPVSESGKWKLYKNYPKLLPKISNSEFSSREELAGSFNLDFHSRAMIVFSTKGDVVNLPQDSTALDFSFFFDEKNADKSSAGYVNGEIVPLWTTLNSGDRVKTLYSGSRQVNASWLSFVNSEKARKIIQKAVGKKPKTRGKDLVKFRIEAVDRPGLLRDQAIIMSANGLDMETTVCKMNDDATTCYTEFYVRLTKKSNIRRAIKTLQREKDTLKVTADFFSRKKRKKKPETGQKGKHGLSSFIQGVLRA